ncbi:MAG: cell surface protein SprA, partial [Olleya sp.]
MNTNQHSLYKSQKYILLTVLALLVSVLSFAQEDNEVEQDSTKTGFSLGALQMPNPSSIESKYTYDPVTDRYIYTESVGEFNINYPVILTPQEYQDLVSQQTLKSYYKDKIDAYDGKKGDAKEAQKNLIPEWYVTSSFFESIFGEGPISIVPQGTVEMDLGVLFTKQDNPSFSPRNRRNFSFDFDQRISLSMLGKVGSRLQVTANYDTQSTFDFQNLVKLEYTPTED